MHGGFTSLLDFRVGKARVGRVVGMTTIETVSSTYGGYMAESKTMELGSGETWWFTDESYPDGSGHIEVVDMVGRVMVNLEDVDAFCEALKAFRDEVTKPKMTGGEKVMRAYWEVRGLMGSPLPWAERSDEAKAEWVSMAALLGIKDDE